MPNSLGQIHFIYSPYASEHLPLMGQLGAAKTYPPYNVVKLEGEDKYAIDFAVAGFCKEDLEITQTENVLRVKGKRPAESEHFLQRGIGLRDFETVFQLDRFVSVTSVHFRKNGLLRISLVKDIPEAQKPKSFTIAE